MRRLLTFAVAILILPAVLVAQSSSPPATQQPATASPPPAAEQPAPQELAKEDEIQPGDSPLVRAAKTARANRRGKPSKVIDNNDVKNSTGKLILITEKPLDTTPATVPPLPDEVRKDTKAVSPAVLATQQVAAARKEVEDLEKELTRLEEDFYNEDDPNYRDGVIEPRFQQAQKQLEKARQKLLDAREEQQKREAEAATRRSEP